MKVFIKNKFASIGGASQVLDENKQLVYKVKGNPFSIFHKKRIYDINNNLIYVVKNKYWHAPFTLPKVFICSPTGEKIAKLSKKIRFSTNYVLEDYKDEITIDGTMVGFDLSVSRNGQVVANIKRNFTFIVDSFELEAAAEDIPFMVALVIAMDNLRDKITNESKSTH